MGLLSDLGLGAARSLRTRLGARGALRVLSPMIASSDPSPARAAAIVVALECAAEVGDADALESLATWWAVEHVGARTADVAPVIASLLRTSKPLARVLADAEVLRRDHPLSRALRAVVHEQSGALDDAAADWRSAASEAERAGDPRRARAARVELARLLARQSGRKLDAARVASSIPEDDAGARERLVLAIARLGETGRYARVRGLDALVELASQRDETIARAAIRAACAHADESGAALTGVELERVRSAAAKWPDPHERARVLATLDAIAATVDTDDAARSAALVRAAAVDDTTRAQLERARAVLSGGAVGPRPSRDAGTWCALAVIASLRAGRDDDARDRVRELRAIGVGDGEPAAWTAAWCALARPATRPDAIALAEALLATRGTPPRGFLHIASHLEHAGAETLALRAMARAHEQREPGAKERRIEALVRAGWRAWSEGRRDDAREHLLEARAARG
ncbi:hypothetical protein [Sandaracinus amylolyticus]|uniref:TPR domain protein, putative component of TonB system n=1 Tax=Sandaracinus amylolyticus TaxID=927083 RepID=A0A0F6YJ15_9BACT|nr:hypothetical protein [Sandaracinus amylolyticus]AKF07366.1 TPR domain protein, putative component of TonB system [Sandaracinus amylolyticus]